MNLSPFWRLPGGGVPTAPVFTDHPTCVSIVLIKARLQQSVGTGGPLNSDGLDFTGSDGSSNTASTGSQSPAPLSKNPCLTGANSPALVPLAPRPQLHWCPRSAPQTENTWVLRKRPDTHRMQVTALSSILRDSVSPPKQNVPVPFSPSIPPSPNQLLQLGLRTFWPETEHRFTKLGWRQFWRQIPPRPPHGSFLPGYLCLHHPSDETPGRMRLHEATHEFTGQEGILAHHVQIRTQVVRKIPGG